MDRLSELPDSVIFHIFWFLPMREVVRTTILSRRWKDLWTTTPFLYFDDFIEQFDTRDKLRIFVHRVLSRWDGVKILKFKVELDHEESIHRDVDLWLRFAKKYGVEELYLHMVIEDRESCLCNDDDIRWLPQFLYSCSSLKVLSIENCYFRFKGNVHWNHLKSLTIINGFGVTEDVINQIFCGSPQLEVLIMTFIDSRFENFSIRSTSLKKLSINKHFYDDYEDPSPYTTELRIWTPNLKTLEMKGIPYGKCLLMNVSSLNHATLGYPNLHHLDERCFNDPSEYNSSLLPTNQFLGYLFGQILPSIQHVENITLSSCCVKVLDIMKMKHMHSSFPNIKSLDLRCCLYDYKQIVGILEIFPQLERLVLKYNKVDRRRVTNDQVTSDKESLKFEVNNPESFLLKLRTVEVTWAEGDGVFSLIEILLKYATKLEKIGFQVEIKSPNSLLSVSQKLLRMRGFSINCTIDLTTCNDGSMLEAWELDLPYFRCECVTVLF
ncbi:F-box/LRR-repeat protein At3g03360-like [Salvia miltiorrhiza]|uniref:F-box/LRR-repeat protein At3g03360-like n=1 Tax=Salvia miltiorrhiza TaxID=226208 RepID=UPI0025ABF5B8|nr:F-box/LRR-repeat protein At3g03360-like [Salvia miltiorrhiza]XP_057771455.1 F-box/LRR-repeat protein At3g03360-like [Salvia miltiorrhiza]